MEMICKGLTAEECFQAAVEEYENQLNDKKAESQTKTQPLRQALRFYKFLHGYGGKETMQHDKELTKIWEGIKLKTMKHFLVWDIHEIPAERLAEANLYAIELMKELL